jgi:hypothetical protein
MNESINNQNYSHNASPDNTKQTRIEYKDNYSFILGSWSLW